MSIFKNGKQIRLIILSLTIIADSFSYSQNVNYIEKYHKVIYKAENMITRSNYDSALYFYDKAFNNVSYAFCYDYGNAAYIAYKARNKSLAIQYLDSAVLRGMRYKRQFKRYFDSEIEWKKWKETVYDSLDFAGTLRLDSSKINIVDSLYETDQLYRKDKKCNLDSILLIDKCNADFIVKYFKIQTLGERDLGFAISRKLSIIYFHNLLKNQQLMYDLYKSGQIEKRDYYYSVVRKTLQFGEDSKFLKTELKKTSPDDMKLLDINRQKEGIPTIDELKKLHRFAAKSNSLFFTLAL